MSKNRKLKRIILLLWMIFLLMPALSHPQKNDLRKKSGLKKVTFLPMWVPQPQFAGYYMAKEKGIYEKYGLEVNITPGGYLHNVPASLKTGEADFGIMFLYSAVMERAKGSAIVNIGQIFQRSSIMFVARKSSGIKSLKDFNGKRIGVWRTTVRELTEGFLRRHNINAEIVEFDKGINVFLQGAVDITVMMNYNEYKRLINSGVDPGEVTKFNFYDYEMNFPEDGIYCMEKTFMRDPDMCRKFVQASIEGWTYALDNMDETIKVLDKYRQEARVPYNMSHSLWQLKAMKDMIGSSGKNVRQGELLKSDFDGLTDFLFSNKFISNKPLYTDFFKGDR